MSNTVAVDAKTMSEILKRLDQLAKDVADLKEKLFSAEPIYGSDEWWEWSIKESLKDIKKGKFTKIRNKKELQTHLDSLKRS